MFFRIMSGSPYNGWRWFLLLGCQCISSHTRSITIGIEELSFIKGECYDSEGWMVVIALVDGGMVLRLEKLLLGVSGARGSSRLVGVQL